MQVPWFVAFQFLKQYRSQTGLTVAAVGVGVAVMVFLSALITGLQASLIRQTMGTQAHISILPPEQSPRPLRPDAGNIVRLQKSPQRTQSLPQWQKLVARVVAHPQVKAVAALATGEGFATRGNANRPVTIWGTDVEAFDRVLGLRGRVVSGQYRLNGNEAAIGVRLADDLGIALGDQIRVSNPDGGGSLLSVQALFDLGNQQVNQRWVVVPLRMGQTLLRLPGGANRLSVRVDELFDAERVAQTLAAQSGLDVRSWMQTNAQLLVALRSQQSSSYTIQFFIFLAVAMGISSVLVVSVVQRTREIGILRAIGMPREALFKVFLLQGAVIGLGGSVVGALGGTLLALIFANIAPAPDGSPTFPMALTPGLYVAAVGIATLTGVVAAAVPAQRAAVLNPVEAIRHD